MPNSFEKSHQSTTDLCVSTHPSQLGDLTASSSSGVGPLAPAAESDYVRPKSSNTTLDAEGAWKKASSTQERCWRFAFNDPHYPCKYLVPQARCSGSSQWPTPGSWSYGWPLGRVCTSHVEGISPGGTETGLPTTCAHCQGHRRTEEALLVPGCPKPAMKPWGASFNPHTQCIFSAEAPLAGEGSTMTGQEERESWGKESKISTQFWHSTTAHKWMNYSFCGCLVLLGVSACLKKGHKTRTSNCHNTLHPALLPDSLGNDILFVWSQPQKTFSVEFSHRPGHHYRFHCNHKKWKIQKMASQNTKIWGLISLIWNTGVSFWKRDGMGCV